MRKHKSFFWQMVWGAMILIAAFIFWPIETDNNFNRLDISDKQLVFNGKKIYSANCASCHGVNLEGQANWEQKGADGLYPAPPQTDAGHSWRHPDQYLIDAVKNGQFENGKPTNMPAFAESLTDAEIISVLTYIKSKWSAEKRAIQRKTQEDSLPGPAIYGAG
ncbi:MAG: cytochrome c [Methylophilus sp.]|nr:cytochrome c [Methylophilus sp.]